MRLSPVLAGIIAVVGLAWIYLLAGGGMGAEQMDMGGGNMMLMPPAWSVPYAAQVFAMWAVMMVAMMLPSATPVILKVASDGDKSSELKGGIPAVLFAAGYLMVWIGFSLVATLVQWALDSTHLLSETISLRSQVGAGLIVIGAGLYQLTPVKQSCLRSCGAFSCLTGDRGHVAAIVREGTRYGVSCLGCCAFLMCILFVVGVMNVLWIAVLALWVLAEKTLPWGSRIARLSAGGLIAWGGISILR